MNVRLVLALLVGFSATPFVYADEVNGRRAPLPPDLAAVPGDAVGFIHIRVADIWKSEALKDARETVLRAGAKALEGFDKRFLPAPSSLDRLTVVWMMKDQEIEDEPLIYGVLSFNKPFDRDEFLKSAMPDSVEKKTTNGSYWILAKNQTAVAFIDKQIIVFGPVTSVAKFVDKRSSGPGPLTDVLHAVDPRRQITIGGNLGLIPEKAHQEVPPPLRPLLRAKTGLLSFDLLEGSMIDLNIGYADEKSATAAMSAVDDLTKMGRGFVKKTKEDTLAMVLGDGKIAPLEKLPESALALLALGSLERVDGFLADPPIKQERDKLRVSIAMPSLSYASMAPLAAGLLLPAVQKVREAAARSQSMNNMRQCGLAMHVYHDAMGQLPPAAICDKNGKPLLSWRVAILPYIEQQNLYERFKLDEPWDSEHNKKLIPLMPKIYLSQSAPPATEPGLTHYRCFDGKDVLFDLNRKARLEAVEDGLSNTIAYFETAEPIIWTKPDGLTYDEKKPLPKFAAFSNGGFIAVLGDGSVRLIPGSTPEKTLRALFTARGGETVDVP